MKCKHELCYSGSSTAQKQVLRATRTPRKPGTVSTKAVASENTNLCLPCQGSSDAPGDGGSWDGSLLRGFLSMAHIWHQQMHHWPLQPPRDVCLMLRGAQCPHSVPIGLQTASPPPPHSLWPFCLVWERKGRDGHAMATITWFGSSISYSGVCWNIGVIRIFFFFERLAKIQC